MDGKVFEEVEAHEDPDIVVELYGYICEECLKPCTPKFFDEGIEVASNFVVVSDCCAGYVVESCIHYSDNVITLGEYITAADLREDLEAEHGDNERDRNEDY